MSSKLFRLMQQMFFSKKVLTFFTCLFVAVFLWFINALNRNYQRFVYIPVRYINLPKNRVIAGELPRQIQTEIKASGAKLMFIRFKGVNKEIVIDVEAVTRKKNTKVVAMSAQSLVGNVSKILNSEVELLRVKPDSIYFNFGKSYQKIIPVKPDLYANLRPNYSYTDKVKVTPAFVTITGDSALVSEIDSIRTERIVLNKLNQNISQTADLVLAEDIKSRVSLSNTEVVLQLSVDKYTEATVDVPVSVLHLPKSYQLKSFPKVVQVKYQVPMGDYEKINELDFKAIIDYEKINLTKSKLNVELVSFPQNVKIIKVYPDKVEYVIRKH